MQQRSVCVRETARDISFFKGKCNVDKFLRERGREREIL